MDILAVIDLRLSLFRRLMHVANNWFIVILAEMGLMKNPVIHFKNGIDIIYDKSRFGGVTMFAEEPYAELHVEGKDVVDVGAFNGDSALYFAMRGARRVYAFEPFPKTYEIAEQNISLNRARFPNIQLLNAGVAGESGEIALDPNYSSDSSSQIVDSPGGQNIRLWTLGEVVRRFQLADAVLKLDCEGSEFGIICKSDQKTLNSFCQIVLEFHGEPTPIIEALERAGFSCRKVDKLGPLMYAEKSDGVSV